MRFDKTVACGLGDFQNMKKNTVQIFVAVFIGACSFVRADPGSQRASDTNAIVSAAKPAEEDVLLTPLPPNEPRINGPEVYGEHPGSPFLYRIPCTGERPITFR